MFATLKAPVPILAALALSAFSFIGSASAATYQADWNFEVLLDKKPIGFHRFSLSGDGEVQTLTTEAQFDVKFLFINAFRYRHDNTETWSGGCLDSIDAKTDNNGDYLVVRGRTYGNSLELTGHSGRQVLGECVQTFAYWNPDILGSSQLLNSQSGELEDVSVSRESVDAIDINGETVEAVRYRLMARKGAITLWYSNDDSRRWLALEAPAKGGRTLRYIPIQIPAADDLPA